MLSQPGIWRYNLVWQKDRVTGHLNANRMPLRQHEDILVFYMKQPVYHPQMTPCPPERRNHGRSMTEGSFTNRCYGEMKSGTGTHGGQQISDIGHFHPERTQDRGILSSDPEACGTGRVPDTHLHRRGGHRAGQLHRVRTTAIAAIRSGRHYIGFETVKEYCDIAELRIREELERIHTTT